MYQNFATRQPLGFVEVFFRLSPVCQSMLRVGDVACLVLRLGVSLDTFICVVFGFVLWDLALFSVTEKWSVCSFSSKVTSIFGEVCSATFLTGRVDISWFSVIFIVAIAVVVIGVGFRFCGCTFLIPECFLCRQLVLSA